MPENLSEWITLIMLLLNTIITWLNNRGIAKVRGA